MPGRKACFPPVAAPGTRLLILGSLPGDASLAAGQYYAHPRNQFWRLLSAVLGADLLALPYDARLQTLQRAGVGLWDVVGSARRHGSLDGELREVEHNDLLTLIATLPALRAVAFNGKTASSRAADVEAMGLPALCLPSSSPAYTLAYEKKLETWLQLGRYL